MELKKLGDFFDPQYVNWREGAINKANQIGLALPYLDSRHIMGRLDQVCGVENWKDEYTAYGHNDDGGLICSISIHIEGRWVAKSDASNCTGGEPLKGAATNAFKRAAVKWRIGRYLYLFPKVWVPVENRGGQGKDRWVFTETPVIEKIAPWAVPSASKQAPSVDSESPAESAPAESDRLMTRQEQGNFLDHAAIMSQTLGAGYQAVCEEFGTVPEEVASYQTAQEMMRNFLLAKKKSEGAE